MPGPPAGQARPRKTVLVHPWPPARHQASPRMPPSPKALEMSDKLIDAQFHTLTQKVKWKQIDSEYQDRAHLRLALLVEPDLFHAVAVIDAVDHRHVALDVGVPARAGAVVVQDRARHVLGQPLLDLPDELLAFFLVRF